MTHCEHCGKELGPGSSICQSCSTAANSETSEQSIVSPPTRNPTTHSRESRSGSGKGLFISLAVLLAVLAIGLGVFAFMQTGKLNAARLNVSNLETNVSNLQANLSSLEGQLIAQKANVASLNTQLIGAKAHSVNLQTELDSTKATLSTTKDNLSAVQGRVASLQTDLDASKTRVTQLENDIITASSKIMTLQTELNKASTDLTKANFDLAAAKTANTTLTNDLNKVKSPRHFTTLQELTNWLAADDTNTNPNYNTLRSTEKTYILQVKAARDGFIISTLVDYDPGAGVTYYSNTAIVGSNVYLVDVASDQVELSSTLPFSISRYPITP